MSNEWLEDNRKYEEKCTTNSNNWAKWWAPKGNQNACKNWDNLSKQPKQAEQAKQADMIWSDMIWSDNDSITSSNEEVNKNKINNKNKTKKNWYSPEFEEFWKAYPLKKGKQKAFKAWTEALKWGNDPNLIIEKAWEYTLEIKHKKTEKSYIKRAQGWLNDGRWDDDYDTWDSGKKPDLDDLY